MSLTWPKTSFVKLHEGCGGVVAWREALGRPAVHFTGECQHCDADALAQEQILPVEVHGNDEYRRAVRDLPLAERAALAWNDDAEWRDNQQRLAREIQGETA